MLSELFFALRRLRKRPGFSIAVIVTLALCIGANTAVLSVLYGLVLKPLPFPNQSQLVEVYNSYPKFGQLKKPASITQYLDFKAHADLFSGAFLFKDVMFTMGGDSFPVRTPGAIVTGDMFTVLGIHPLLGTFFTLQDSEVGRDQLLVLTQSYWEAHCQADPAIVGKKIRIDGTPYTVVGVAPRSLETFNPIAFFYKPYSWIGPLGTLPTRGVINNLIFGRLKDGVSPTQACSQLDALEKLAYRNSVPATRDYLDRGGHRMGVGRVRDEQTKDIRSSLIILQAAVGLVLLLGCVNVANLMLARANSRQSEFAIRQALGAGWAGLARPLVAEAVLLSLAGAVLGMVFAEAALVMINGRLATIVLRSQPARLDGAILAATLSVALLVALATSLLPIYRVWSTNLSGAMQGGSRGASGDSGLRAVSGFLVTAQVTLALLLLIGAGLLIRSFDRAMAVNPGIDARHIINARLVATSGYTTMEKVRWLRQQVVAGMKEIPGVQNVAVSHDDILGGARLPVVTLSIWGSRPDAPDTYPTAYVLGVSSEFFDTMGIKIVEGRGFTAADTATSRPVFVVDRSFAKKYFPGRDAVGHGVNLGGPSLKESDLPMLVGIVEDAKLNGPEDRSGVPFAYYPFDQAPSGGFSIEVRTTEPIEVVLPLMRAKLRDVDPSVPLYATRTLQMGLDDYLANRTGLMVLLGTFAGIALMLAAVGIYGMLAYDVTLRTREIGVRGAVGASRNQIVALILRQGIRKTGIGLIIGLSGALFLTRFIRGLLFDIEPIDPASYAAVSLLLMAVALIACYLPARRASRIDPIVALRCE